MNNDQKAQIRLELLKLANSMLTAQYITAKERYRDVLELAALMQKDIYPEQGQDDDSYDAGRENWMPMSPAMDYFNATGKFPAEYSNKPIKEQYGPNAIK